MEVAQTVGIPMEKYNSESQASLRPERVDTTTQVAIPHRNAAE